MPISAGAQGRALTAFGASSSSSGTAVAGAVVGSASATMASAVSAPDGTTEVAVAVGSV